MRPAILTVSHALHPPGLEANAQSLAVMIGVLCFSGNTHNRNDTIRKPLVVSWLGGGDVVYVFEARPKSNRNGKPRVKLSAREVGQDNLSEQGT